MRRILNNTRRINTVHYMICTSLGYCCEWAFFRLYPDTGLVAARLGVTLRAVQEHKRAAGGGGCEDCERHHCLRRKLALLDQVGTGE